VVLLSFVETHLFTCPNVHRLQEGELALAAFVNPVSKDEKDETKDSFGAARALHGHILKSGFY
jgi:hypothetical protein